MLRSQVINAGCGLDIYGEISMKLTSNKRIQMQMNSETHISLYNQNPRLSKCHISDRIVENETSVMETK